MVHKNGYEFDIKRLRLLAQTDGLSPRTSGALLDEIGRLRVQVATLERAGTAWRELANEKIASTRQAIKERDAAQALIETHEATIDELRNLLSYFVCHMPAQNCLIDDDTRSLHNQMMDEAMRATGTIVDDTASEHAPADLSKRGGLERVSVAKKVQMDAEELDNLLVTDEARYWEVIEEMRNAND
jgi:hypothetical protein